MTRIKRRAWKAGRNRKILKAAPEGQRWARRRVEQTGDTHASVCKACSRLAEGAENTEWATCTRKLGPNESAKVRLNCCERTWSGFLGHSGKGKNTSWNWAHKQKAGQCKQLHGPMGRQCPGFSQTHWCSPLHQHLGPTVWITDQSLQPKCKSLKGTCSHRRLSRKVG